MVEASLPQRVMVPEVGRSMPPNRFISVDFPLPDGPITPNISDRETSMSMPHNADVVASSPPPYVFVNDLADSIACIYLSPLTPADAARTDPTISLVSLIAQGDLVKQLLAEFLL
jgi:hypothetical protein